MPTKKSKAKKPVKKLKKLKPVKSRKSLAKKIKKPGKKPKINKKQKAKKPVIRKPVIKKVVAKKKKSVKKAIVKKPKIIKKTVKKPQKKIVKQKKSTPKVIAPPENFVPETLFKARIKVIGVGGGGGSIVSEIGRSLEKATFVVADTDVRALKKKSGIKYLWFGEEFTRGLGTGVNIDLAKQAAESARDKMGEIFKNQDIIIFIASLGGGLGSGATQVFAEEAKKFSAITLGIFTLPFKFEGKNKSRIALNALKSLRESLNVSITIPNEKIFKVIDESTPITSAFSVVNKSLIGSLESLIDLIYSPGIINIDFADLRTILKGRGNMAFLNTIEESGKDRADKICEKTFINPLLQNNAFTAEKILFNITGADNLSMFEVEKISSHISNLNPKAKIIFGISKSPKLKNKIKTTILMTGGGAKDEIPVKKTKILAEKKQVVLKESKNKKPLPIPKKSPVPFMPGFKSPTENISAVRVKKDLDIVETTSVLAKKAVPTGRQAIRRSALEIKKAEDQEEKKKIAQEKEWEIPAFLRRVKFNK